MAAAAAAAMTPRSPVRGCGIFQRQVLPLLPRSLGEEEVVEKAEEKEVAKRVAAKDHEAREKEGTAVRNNNNNSRVLAR